MGPALLNIFGVLIIGSLIAVALVFVVLLSVKFFKGFFRSVGWVIRHVASFIGGMLGDSFRTVGALIAAVALSLLVVLNVVIARWSNATHFARALRDEIGTAGRALYRVCVGHPAKFLLLNGLTEGVEVRVANAVAAAPGSDKPSKRTGEFDGYTIVGSLKGGGSGGKLFVAEPDERKRSGFERRGLTDVDQVVIKSFSLKDGSSMPQIVRESRALEAAKKLGLVLEHELSEERFYYVMPYVPGESLGTVTQRLHAQSGSGGLGRQELRHTLELVADLLGTLSVYHRGGLWHKDIKPDNIIVSGNRATLVDLGLVTPLRSAMTLTTHGTEYFRDPEMVRMALRGAKVHEVDGVKFDIYGAGAVLFSAVENSFPAHGGLSQLTKRCPDALRWIIRRSMTELNQRYASAEEMLADLRVVIEADDPFALKPKDLPSMGGAMPAEQHASDPVEEGSREPDWVFAGAAHAAGPAAVDPKGGQGMPADPQRRPRFRVQDWLTGRYSVEDVPVAGMHRAASPVPPAAAAMPPRRAAAPRSPLTAAEQRARAQERVRAAQQRARDRRSARHDRFSTNPNRHVVIGVVVGLGVLLLVGATILMPSRVERIAAGPHWSPATPVIGLFTYDANDSTTLWLLNDDGRLALGTKSEGSSSAWIKISQMPGMPMPLLEPDHFRRIVRGGSEPGGSVLVVNKVSERDSEEALETVNWLLGQVRSSGLTVRGLDNAQADIDAVARVEAMVGLTRIFNYDHSRLRAWLNEQPELDSLIWIESRTGFNGEIIPNEIRAVLVTGSGDALGELRRLEPELKMSDPSPVTFEGRQPSRIMRFSH